MSTTPAPLSPFAPSSAQARTPIPLAMQRLWLTGQISPAGARLEIQHVFRSAEKAPIEVIYSFGLPRDSALRSFRITGDNFEIHSELKPVDEAVKAYESGIMAGSLSTLAQQYADGVVNLTVGNIRPGEAVTVHLDLLAGVALADDGYRFRFPFTLSPAYHSRMKTAIVDGEGEMELPRDEFGYVILPRWRTDASDLHEVGFHLTLVNQIAADEIGSPSHAIRVRSGPNDSSWVSLAPERDVPDRDLVLDVHYCETKPQVIAGAAPDNKRHFAAIVPSVSFGMNTASPRRVVILLDRSYSMKGSPFNQARKAIEACLAVLSESDLFGIVAFDDHTECMHPELLNGSRENRDRARSFLKTVEPRGSTELVPAVNRAVKMLAGAGDVFVITDGQVAGTEQILAQARVTKTRLFCLGIGDASQDRFLAALARETGAVGRFLTPRERVDVAAIDLFAATGPPIASGLKVGNSVLISPPDSVFAGHPVLLLGSTTADSDENIEICWDGGRLELPIPQGPPDIGESLRLVQGSRLITDWENRYPHSVAQATLEVRKLNRVAARLVELSSTYGLMSREMALVAVVNRAGDRPGDLPETRVVPVGMPQGTQFDAYFKPPQVCSPATAVYSRFGWNQKQSRAVLAAAAPMPVSLASSTIKSEQAETELVELAAQIEPDGGLPGGILSDRVARTIAAMLAFLSAGNSLDSGAFRSHMFKLVAFVRSMDQLPPDDWRIINQAVQRVSRKNPVSGDWLALAKSAHPSWKNIRKLLEE